MKYVYALLWKPTAPQAEFEKRIPRLMAWLRDLKGKGLLAGCGGFGDTDGGLTLVHAGSRAEAEAIAGASPQAEVGTTEVFEWEVYFASLVVERPGF